MLPYLIITGNRKCYLQVMELHRADGVEPVHHLLRMEQDRTESLARATVGHLNSPSCTTPLLTTVSSPSPASPSHAHSQHGCPIPHMHRQHICCRTPPTQTNSASAPALLPAAKLSHRYTNTEPEPPHYYLQQLTFTHSILPMLYPI